MTLMCLFGLHKWRYDGVFTHNGYSGPLVMDTAERTCICCGKEQQREKHCLGLNPPKYIYEWRNLK